MTNVVAPAFLLPLPTRTSAVSVTVFALEFFAADNPTMPASLIAEASCSEIPAKVLSKASSSLTVKLTVSPKISIDICWPSVQAPATVIVSASSYVNLTSACFVGAISSPSISGVVFCLMVTEPSLWSVTTTFSSPAVVWTACVNFAAVPTRSSVKPSLAVEVSQDTVTPLIFTVSASPLYVPSNVMVPFSSLIVAVWDVFV